MSLTISGQLWLLDGGLKTTTYLQVDRELFGLDIHNVCSQAIVKDHLKLEGGPFRTSHT